MSARDQRRVARAASLAVASVLIACACACALACGNGLARFAKTKPVDSKVLASICATELGGAGARVRVWRAPEGDVAVLELRPDTKKHGPRSMTTFYDDSGRETLRVYTRHPVPSSPDALEEERRREGAIGDAKEAEQLPCDAGDAGAR